MNQNKIFQSSVKIWLNQFLFTLVGLVCAIILLIILMNMLNIDTMQYYDKYIQMGVVVFGFFGLMYGTNRIYRVIREEKKYLSRKTKYLVLIYQLIAFAGFTAICLSYKLSAVYFVGAYLTIFIQFLLNYYYTKYNNHKFPKSVKKVKQVSKRVVEYDSASNEGMIDIDKLM